MLVREVMTPQVELMNPNTLLKQAACALRDRDVGVLPVGENDRLVGMLTDRDIAVRAVAAGKHPDNTTVGECMTPSVLYCYEDDSVAEVANNMAKNQIRRLPVVNRDKRLVGIVSLADLAQSASAQTTGETYREIAPPH